MMRFRQQCYLLAEAVKSTVHKSVAKDMGSSSGKKLLRCFNCSKLGHLANNCYKPKRAPKYEGQSSISKIDVKADGRLIVEGSINGIEEKMLV